VKKLVATLAGLVLLFAWQLSIFRTDLQPTYKIQLGGLHSEDHFVYFLYYKNLFPVATMESGRDWDFYFGPATFVPEPSRLVYTKEGAEKIFTDKGSSLVQEWGHTIRNENHLQTYLFLPDAWRRGSPELAETRLTNAAVFMLSLAAVYLAFFFARRFALGLFVVVLIGSNPFQLFSAYREENIKSWPITMFCVAAALIAPLMMGVKLRWPWRVALMIVIGLVFGTTYQIRSETACAMLGVAAVVCTMWDWTWKSRVAMVSLIAASFVVTIMSWNVFFERKIAESTRAVAAAGGHVYPGPLHGYHPLWASLWPGLGDFDRTHGYSLGDGAPIAYLEPLLQSRYQERMPWWWSMSREKQGRDAQDYYDADRIYYRYPFDSPNTATLLREKVIHDVTSDPLWYAGIIVKRIWRILSETTPVQFFLTERVTLRVPFHGVFAILIFGVAAWRRDWAAFRLLLLSLPLSLVPLAITSGAGFTYFSIYHLCAFAVLLSWLASWLTIWRQGRHASVPAVGST